MKKINKSIMFLFVLFTVVSVMSTFDYINKGIVKTKWGYFNGESALHALITYWLITLFFAYFSRKKSEEPLPQKKQNFICSRCEQVKTTVKEKEECAKCNILMSSLEGFYEDRENSFLNDEKK